jgi:hypothetical protein
MTWQEADLVEAWDAVAPLVPAPFELTGVTFHGLDASARWVAFIYRSEPSSFGPEGVGETPVEALHDLARRLHDWVPPNGA